MPSIRFLRRLLFDGEGPPRAPSDRPDPARWSHDEITGSCVGHSTVLLNMLGVRILTDPVFSVRVGPRFGPLVLGPQRRIQPALDPRTIAPPDVLLLSHAHFDHFDVPSLRLFDRDTPVVTAPHTADLLRAARFSDVHELAWGQSVELSARGEAVRITAVEVAHWGARMVRDTFRGYNGYLIERAGRRVLFGGDTAYTRAFASLRHSGPRIDLCLMPIGAYNPWIRAHCTPEQAIDMATQAGAKHFVPIHHETFKLSDEPPLEPHERLIAALRSSPERLLASRVGETFRVEG